MKKGRDVHITYYTRCVSFPEENTRAVVLFGSVGRALTLGGLGNKAAWPAGASSSIPHRHREKGAQRTVLPENEPQEENHTVLLLGGLRPELDRTAWPSRGKGEECLMHTRKPSETESVLHYYPHRPLG